MDTTKTVRGIGTGTSSEGAIYEAMDIVDRIVERRGLVVTEVLSVEAVLFQPTGWFRAVVTAAVDLDR
jgi:hypothetical protein